MCHSPLRSSSCRTRRGLRIQSCRAKRSSQNRRLPRAGHGRSAQLSNPSSAGICPSVVLQLICPRECGSLARHHGIGIPTAGNLPSSAPHRNVRSIAVCIDIDAVVAGLHNHERHVRRVDLHKSLRRPRGRTSHHQRSLRQTNLRRAVADFEQSNPSLQTEPERSRSNVHFGPRIFIRPQIVAGDQGTIRARQQPSRFHRPVEITPIPPCNSVVRRGSEDPDCYHYQWLLTLILCALRTL